MGVGAATCDSDLPDEKAEPVAALTALTAAAAAAALGALSDMRSGERARAEGESWPGDGDRASRRSGEGARPLTSGESLGDGDLLFRREEPKSRGGDRARWAAAGEPSGDGRSATRGESVADGDRARSPDRSGDCGRAVGLCARAVGLCARAVPGESSRDGERARDEGEFLGEGEAVARRGWEAVSVAE